MKNIEDAALTARKSLKDVFNVNLVYPISPKLLDKIVSQFGIVLKKDAECVYYLRKSKHGNAVIYYDDETKADFLYAVIVLFGCVLFDFKNMRSQGFMFTNKASYDFICINFKRLYAKACGFCRRQKLYPYSAF